MTVRVLMADPDPMFLDSYSKRLEPMGFDVSTARNGLECLENLRQVLPDILVLEPSLSWGGGDGVLAVMREEPGLRDIPVLVLTFGHDRSALYRLAPYHVDDYQTKPKSPRQLAERISQILAPWPEAVLAGQGDLAAMFRKGGT